jgi:hypothetical protein
MENLTMSTSRERVSVGAEFLLTIQLGLDQGFARFNCIPAPAEEEGAALYFKSSELGQKYLVLSLLVGDAAEIREAQRDTQKILQFGEQVRACSVCSASSPSFRALDNMDQRSAATHDGTLAIALRVHENCDHVMSKDERFFLRARVIARRDQQLQVLKAGITGGFRVGNNAGQASSQAPNDLTASSNGAKPQTVQSVQPVPEHATSNRAMEAKIAELQATVSKMTEREVESAQEIERLRERIKDLESMLGAEDSEFPLDAQFNRASQDLFSSFRQERVPLGLSSELDVRNPDSQTDDLGEVGSLGDALLFSSTPGIRDSLS